LSVPLFVSQPLHEPFANRLLTERFVAP
jgi:hypothetical protein